MSDLESEMISQTARIDRAKKIRKKHEWDVYFLRMAQLVSTKSEDPNTQVGCVIVGPNNEVLSTGYNGLARGVKLTKSRMERPEKYFWFEHAERNAIYNAARNGIRIDGATLYQPGWPCTDCARAIIQAGITKVVRIKENAEHDEHNKRWAEQSARSLQMFREAGVLIKIVNIDAL